MLKNTRKEMYTHNLKTKNIKTYSRKVSRRVFLQFSTLNKENPRFKVLKIRPRITPPEKDSAFNQQLHRSGS